MGAFRDVNEGAQEQQTRQLCEQYEVSETVIRFIMIQLKARGLVYGQPGRGVYVSTKH